MRLLTGPNTPFGRKVSVVARELNLQLTEEAVEIAGNAELAVLNPLRLIPVLVLSDGSAVYDSDVICRCLNDYVGGDIYPADSDRAMLTRTALADGLAEACVALTGQLRLPEAQRSAQAIDRYRQRIDRVLDHLEATNDTLRNPVVSIDKICVAVAVGYVDLRQGEGWRQGRPRLSDWIDRVARRPSMTQTRPPEGRF